MTPDEILMTAVRGKLVVALAGLVEPDAIRAGGIRPETFPAVVMSLPEVAIQGYAAGGQIVAHLDMMLNLWARDDDAEAAQRIGAKVLQALMDAPPAQGGVIDRWQRPQLAWVADPLNEALHGAVVLSAVLRWKADE